MRKRSLAAVLVVCLIAAGLTSCQKSPPDPLGWQTQSFRAEVRGRVHGKESAAQVWGTPHGSGWLLEVEYLAPSSVAGIRIRAEVDARRDLCGEAEVTLGGSVYRSEAQSLAGLLAPALDLLVPSSAQLNSVRTDHGAWVYQFSGGTCLVLNSGGIPQSLTSPSCTLTVLWWEWG